MFGHWMLKATKPAATAIRVETITKRRVNAKVGGSEALAARRWAFRSARALAAGGSCGPRSMLRIMRS